FSLACPGVTTPCPSENVGVAVVEIVMVAKEIIDHKLSLLDVRRRTCSSAAHLLVKDRAAHAAAHDQMKHLAAVEASIQHTDTDGDLRIIFSFELANEVVRVGNIAGDHLGILALQFRMEFVQVLS